MTGHKGRAAPPVVGAEWRDFLWWPLYVALLVCLILCALAYQSAGAAAVSVDVGAQQDGAFLSDFYAQERSADPAHPFAYRWTRDASTFRLPGVGRNVPLELTFYLVGRPQGSPPPDFTVIADGTTITTFEPSGYPAQPYTVTIPASANRDDDLTLLLTSKTFSPSGERRQLGVIVDGIAVRQVSGGPVLPPLYPLAWLLVSLLLAYMSVRHIMVSRGASLAAVMGLGAVAALSLAFDRYDLTLFVQAIGVVMICVYLLAVLMPPLAVWTLRKLRVDIGARELRWLMLIFLLAFGVKAAGMMHPRFTYLDHVFRVHQVQELVDNPGLFWDKYQHVTTADQNVTIHTEEQNSMLGQWNLIVPFPYSPIGYFVLAPLGWIWPYGHETELVNASDTLLAALSGTIVFALFAIAARGLGSPRAGVLAAAIVSFAPITYLHFSDGAYPYIWAGWISVVYLTVAICLADRASKPGPFILLSVLSALTILSHTAIAFFALAFVVAVAAVVWVMRWRGWMPEQPPVRFLPLLWSFLVGGVLSLVYYGGYIVPLLTVSLPALFQRGSSSGVGLDQQYLGAQLLHGFFPQIEAHFAVWPALLALVGLLVAIVYVRRATGESSQAHRPETVLFTAPAPSSVKVAKVSTVLEPQRDEKHQENAGLDRGHVSRVAFHAPSPVAGGRWPVVRTVTLVFLIAWTITFLAFSAIDLRVNLLQRHMLFGLPLIALLGGYALARMDVRTGGRIALLRPAPVLAGLLVAYLFLTGLSVWGDRVLHYILPPGSG